ncbi:MAG: immunoglobulin domain-containing protein, partial [Verrucomicrobia bacterium]|nr:immunoglobulin domain-containing protein [Verrucomicrobiota bacterium]
MALFLALTLWPGTVRAQSNRITLLTTFTNPTPTVSTNFGISLAALGSDRVIIGSPWADAGPAADAGAVYLFRTNGTLLRTFTNPTPAAFDFFGYSVAAVGNDRVLIGAFSDNTGATDAGAAYLFNTNGTLLTTFTKSIPAADDHFGVSVAAVGSDLVLIGADGDSTGATRAGAAYLFSTNGTLLTTFTNPTPAANDGFASSIAAMGSDRVLIGAYGADTGASSAGAAYLFNTNGTLLNTFTNPMPAGSGWFGWSVTAMTNDYVLIGAPYDDTGAFNSGLAYLFSTNGTLLTTFTNPTPANLDNFGWSVMAMSSDRVLIGSGGDDMGVLNAGVAYLFGTNGTLLAIFTNPTPAANAIFGNSVAALGNDRVLIAAPNDNTGASLAGAAYLFNVPTNFAPDMVAQPHNQTNSPATTATFSLTASGDTPLTYRWLKNTTSLSDGGNVSGGGTAVLSLANVGAPDVAGYSVVVANAYGAVTSVVATLSLALPAGFVAVNGTAAFTENFDGMGATGTNPPAGWFVGTGTGAISGTNVAISTGTSTTGTNYNFGTNGVNPLSDRALGSLASSSTVRDTEVRLVNTSGSLLTALAITYTGEQWRQGGSTAVNNDLVMQYSVNGTAFTAMGAAFNFSTPFDNGSVGAMDGNRSTNRVTISGAIYTPAQPLTNGQVFYLRWMDADDSGTDHALAIDDVSISFTLSNAAPVIVTSPPSVTVATGANVTFSVYATGSGGLGYQWQKNGTNLADGGNLSGATTGVLNLANVQPGDAGSYAVVVTNSGGSVTSAAATLIVTGANTAPTDIALGGTSVFENQPAGTLVGALAATDPDSGDTATFTLVPGTGGDDNAGFTITNGTNLVTAAAFDYETKNSYGIRVRVTDSGGLFFEKPFTIAVTDVNEAFTTLVEFNNNTAPKGYGPTGSLVQGTDGNFYGLTYQGGANGFGTVFQMTPAGVLTTLVEFNNNTAPKGRNPYGSLVQGTDGNFYGLTYGGGANDYGTAFKMTPAGVLTTLVEFRYTTPPRGAYPRGSLVQGTDGNFYGLTSEGGANGFGTAFQMTPAGGLTTLTQFKDNTAPKGASPYGSLAQG